MSKSRGRPAKAPGERKVSLTVTIDPKVQERVVELAGAQGISVSSLVERLLKDEIERCKPLPDSSK